MISPNFYSSRCSCCFKHFNKLMSSYFWPLAGSLIQGKQQTSEINKSWSHFTKRTGSLTLAVTLYTKLFFLRLNCSVNNNNSLGNKSRRWRIIPTTTFHLRIRTETLDSSLLPIVKLDISGSFLVASLLLLHGSFLAWPSDVVLGLLVVTSCGRSSSFVSPLTNFYGLLLWIMCEFAHFCTLLSTPVFTIKFNGSLFWKWTEK